MTRAGTPIHCTRREARPGLHLRGPARAVLAALASGAPLPLGPLKAAQHGAETLPRSEKHRGTTVANLAAQGYLERRNIAGRAHWQLTPLGFAALAPAPVEYSRHQRVRHRKATSAPPPPGRDTWADLVAARARPAPEADAQGPTRLIAYGRGHVRVPVVRSVFDLGATP